MIRVVHCSDESLERVSPQRGCQIQGCVVRSQRLGALRGLMRGIGQFLCVLVRKPGRGSTYVRCRQDTVFELSDRLRTHG